MTDAKMAQHPGNAVKTPKGGKTFVVPPFAGGAKGLKVDRPDVDDYNQKIAEERREIAELIKKMTELNRKISEARSGQVEYVRKRNELRQEQDELAAKIEALDTERAKTYARIEETEKEGRDMKSQVQTLKRDLGFQSEHEIDAKIKDIEKLMMSKRLSVQEENKLIAQIKQLRNNKPLIGQYADMQANADSHAVTSLVPLKLRADTLREELKALQQKKHAVTLKVRAMIEENQKSLRPVRELTEEKDELKTLIAQHRQEEQRLIQELDDKMRAYRSQVAEMQRSTQERRREEQRLRDFHNEREKLQKQLDRLEDEATWNPAYHLTLQTLLYVKSLVKASAEDTTPEEEGQNVEENAAVDAEGRILVKPKNKRDDEYAVAPTKKKKSTKKPKKPTHSTGQPLVHDMQVLADFEKLHIEPPLVIEDCAQCIHILEEKLNALKAEDAASEASTLKRKQQIMGKLQALAQNTAQAAATAAECPTDQKQPAGANGKPSAVESD